ncbi:type II toxin-antitoxin system RelE/ParE family toxin [Nonomuraea angiospora]|uniref:type II toxin-antitoxin system RelE family toxin n=1 Tax=Nonomuraea angiospora TaxID=46172 RepID=UPI00344B7102
MSDVVFTAPAVDDLRRIGPDVVLKEILLLLDNPEAGYPLGGDLTGFRKLVVGRNPWRVVYRITDDKSVEICEVWAVGERADTGVYAEAKARVREAGYCLKRSATTSKVPNGYCGIGGTGVSCPVGLTSSEA